MWGYLYDPLKLNIRADRVRSIAARVRGEAESRTKEEKREGGKRWRERREKHPQRHN